MKIFLLNPEPPYYRRGLVVRRNRIFPPISLAIIAHSLERSGHDVVLCDANALQLKEGAILKEIRRFRPDLLIYSSDRHDAWQLPVPSNDYIRDFLTACAKDPGMTEEMLVIGPHGTLFPDQLLSDAPQIRYLVRGEPEVKTLAFVEALDKGEPFEAGGISFRRQNGEVVHNPDPGFIPDLDALPLPAYHLLPMHLYQDNTAPGHPFGLVVTSRGCPMSCIFCSKSMYGSKFRTRSIDKVLEEVDLLVRRYNVTRLFFHDQILLFKQERIEKLLNAMIEARYKVSWRCQTRLTNLNREILTLMRRSGCTEVHVGLESISKEVQKAVKKRDAGMEKFEEIHALGKELGIAVSPNMIIGLPGESYESIMESAHYYHDHGFPFLVNVAIPYPDTQLFQMGKEEGKIRETNWDAVVDAAGLPGNSLSTETIWKAIAEIDLLNRKLHRSRLTLKQKIMKAPGYLIRKVLGKVLGR